MRIPAIEFYVTVLLYIYPPLYQRPGPSEIVSFRHPVSGPRASTFPSSIAFSAIQPITSVSEFSEGLEGNRSSIHFLIFVIYHALILPPFGHCATLP